MKLRMQLALAFLLLAVLPLSLISLYSYTSSLRALRQAAREESDTLASDMKARLASVSRDLSARMGNLGRLDFRGVFDQNRRAQQRNQQELTTMAQALSNQVQAAMGDYASLLKSVEITPVQTESAAPSVPRSASPEAAPQQTQPATGTGGIRIDLTGGLAASAADQQTQVEEEEKVRKLEDLAKMVDKLAQQQERLDSEARRDMPTRGRINGPPPASTDRGSESQGRETAQVQRPSSPDRRVESSSPESNQLAAEVHTGGQVVGTISAQVSTRDILFSVLRQTQRRQGEIAFAIDAEGNLYTPDTEDTAQIEALPLEISIKRTTTQAAATRADNWVWSTQKDSASGATFGIARPIGGRQTELRQTAVRNLAYGLGMVGLALIGIIPLSGKMTRDLEALTHCAEKLAGGDLQTRAPVRSKNEFGQLSQAFNHMAQTLSENEKKLVEQERLSKELEMCRQIQEDLLPKGMFVAGIVEAEGKSIPAREVGGDFFNYFPLPDGSVALLMGDVSGKGLPAALLMANLQATVRARLPLELDLAKLAEELDLSIKESTPPELYLTLFIGVFNPETLLLRYVNAGHNTQFAISAEGDIGYLESTGRPLGLLPGGGYTEIQVELGYGDSLFFYTDGLVETMNPAGEEFGMERLEALLLREQRGADTGMLARIEKSIREYRGDAEVWDDATMLLVKLGIPYPC